MQQFVARPFTLVALMTLATTIASVPCIGSPKRPPIAVKTAIVRQVNLTDTIEALGTTKAINSITLTPNTTEKVASILFQDGQVVSKGDLLVELNQAEEQAQLKSANASLSEAKAAYERALDLFKTRDISEATLKARKTDLLEAEAKVIEIRARIRDLQIIAPFDGVIGLSDVSLGALVTPGDPIATLDDLTKLHVDFEIPGKFVGQVKPGQNVTGRVAAYPEAHFAGFITSTDPRVDPNSRAFTARAVIDNVHPNLKSGMLMAMTVHYNERKSIVIPSKAIVPEGSKNFVFRLESYPSHDTNPHTNPDINKVKRIPVTIGSRLADRVEILTGLAVGDHIVTEGQIKLHEGVIVKPVSDRLSQSAHIKRDDDQ